MLRRGCPALAVVLGHRRRVARGSTLALTILAGVPLAVAPKDAIADATVADQEHGHQEHQAADSARFPLQEESDQVQHDEHDVGLHEGRIRRLRNQQHRNQALQTVHDGCVSQRRKSGTCSVRK